MGASSNDKTFPFIFAALFRSKLLTWTSTEVAQEVPVATLDLGHVVAPTAKNLGRQWPEELGLTFGQSVIRDNLGRTIFRFVMEYSLRAGFLKAREI
jgi:hypothetical protein